MTHESSQRAHRTRLRRGLDRLLWATNLTILLAVGVPLIAILHLRDSQPSTTAFMLLARRADPATGSPCERIEYRWVAREQISPHLKLAVAVAEDQRFLLHSGFDLGQIQKAVRDHETGGRLRGASTISQQVAKNLFLWPSGGFVRKGIEAWLTLWIEWLWDKPRILEVYLNVAQFGPCTFGAEAASRLYFERPARALEPAQAALLASVLPSPAKLRAWSPGPYTLERRDEILALMGQLRDAPHMQGL